MTGITKDELMQMAREAGLIDFYNAILERAAVECGKVDPVLYWNGDRAITASSCCQAVRALKINTGD